MKYFSYAPLLLVPLAIILEYVHASAALVFVASAAAIIPLAHLMGIATEELAARTGPTFGGLMNATLGNAAELIIGIFALRAGLIELVKASLTGSIIGNLLLILGLSMFVGGLRNETQKFNRQAAGMNVALLVLAAVGLVVPALFDFTHPRGALVVATVFVAWLSEILVGATEETIAVFGVSELFLGVIVIPLVGNAAEHGAAVMMAAKNKMDLSFSIAVGSSTQIALFVAPLMVFISLVFGNPMNLAFTAFEVGAVALSVGVVTVIALDGESNWLEGAQLLAVYIILAAAFYFF
jgi:Ca2+:H+ antiporter